MDGWLPQALPWRPRLPATSAPRVRGKWFVPATREAGLQGQAVSVSAGITTRARLSRTSILPAAMVTKIRHLPVVRLWRFNLSPCHTNAGHELSRSSGLPIQRSSLPPSSVRPVSRGTMTMTMTLKEVHRTVTRGLALQT